jgi:putative flippase GtrA
MEEAAIPPRPRRRLLAKFTGVALVGFAFSFATLHLGLELGLPAWTSRLIALLVAMHVTFFINSRFVFKALTRDRFLSLWAAYVANSAVGNLCNYLVFVGLLDTHWPVMSRPDPAFVAGAVTAWAINFTGARFLVFGAAGRRLAARVRGAVVSRPSRPSAPARAERVSSRR